MEEEKAAAYYEELSRKGEGAAKFKQGLGFSSSKNDAVPRSSSSFLSSFVRASSPSKFEKQAQLQSIQNKLTKKPQHPSSRSRSPSRHRSPSRERDPKRRSRDSSRRYRSRSRSKSRDSYREKREKHKHTRRRSVSPRPDKNRPDYTKLIPGYQNMTPAERVKAKMKLQLSETARKDETKGMGSGWERFDFNKDAPLDDEEIEATEDDAALVNRIGKSFRFSAVETKREEQIKAAHDEAIFGAPSLAQHPPSTERDDETEEDNGNEDASEIASAASLISGQAITMQQGSWRDRARRS